MIFAKPTLGLKQFFCLVCFVAHCWANASPIFFHSLNKSIFICSPSSSSFLLKSASLSKTGVSRQKQNNVQKILLHTSIICKWDIIQNSTATARTRDPLIRQRQSLNGMRPAPTSRDPRLFRAGNCVQLYIDEPLADTSI